MVLRYRPQKKLAPTVSRMRRFDSLLEATEVGKEPNYEKLQELKERFAFLRSGWGKMIHEGWYHYLPRENLIDSARFVLTHGNINPKSRVLSIGPGGGHIELFLRNEMAGIAGPQTHAGDLLAVDIDPTVIPEAQKIFDKAGRQFPIRPRMMIRGPRDAEGFHRTKYASKFDTILAINSLPAGEEHYNRFIDDFATAIRRKPGSRLVISALMLPPRADRSVTFDPQTFVRNLEQRGRFKVLSVDPHPYKSGTEDMKRWLIVAKPLLN